MGRPLRAIAAEFVYRVVNHANARRILFEDDGDYVAFERLSGEEWFLRPLSGLCIRPGQSRFFG